MPREGDPLMEDGRASRAAAGGHLAHIDAVRALAALYVMLHHAWLTIWPPEYGMLPGGIVRRLTGWLLYGHFGVAVFIVVSGYCLMLPVARRGGELRGGARRFFARRVRRIVPPYLAALVLSLALVGTLIGAKTGTHWDVCLPYRWGTAWIYALLLQDLHFVTPPNHAFWSIAVEWHIYFLFPLLVLLWRRVGPLAATLIAVAVGLAGHALLNRTPLAGLTQHFLGLFAMGALAAHIAHSPDVRLRDRLSRVSWLGLAAVAMVPVVVWCWRHPWLQVSWKFAYLDLPVGFAAASVLLAAGLSPKVASSLAPAWLVRIGTFSYSVYLVHAPLLQVVWQYAIHPLGLGSVAEFALLSTVGSTLTVGAAYVFFLAFERPFLSSAARAGLAPTLVPSAAMLADEPARTAAAEVRSK